MKGPLLSCPSSVLAGPDDEPASTPEEQIATFKKEILAAIPVERFEYLEDTGALLPASTSAEIVALYLARFGHFKSPWWADEALRKLFRDRLPVTKALEIAHARAADLRIANDGQHKSQYLRQVWEDQALFLVATMREAGVSVTEASRQAARWRDEIGAGAITVQASTNEKAYPGWVADPLRGKVWCKQLSQEMERLASAEKADLLQANRLRARMLPPCPVGLRGNRRD